MKKGTKEMYEQSYQYAFKNGAREMNLNRARFGRSMHGGASTAMCAWLVALATTTTARGQCPPPRQMAQLFASDGAANDFFAYSVAISGDTLIVGANQDDTSRGTDAGSVYVFVCDAEGVW